MGMAASQARFLGLTARQNNVEYEGQQINQQRTTLSNQSANYYNQLIGMAVPVPPSVEDYTKTVYTFEDGALTNSITSMIAHSGGLYKISYVSSWTDDFAAVGAPTAIVTNANGPQATNVTINTNSNYAAFAAGYSVGATTLRKIDWRYDTSSKNYKNLGNQSVTTGDLEDFGKVYNDEYLKSLSTDQLTKLIAEEKAYVELLERQYGHSTNGWAVRYVENTTTGTWSPIFTNLDVLQSDNTIYDDKSSDKSLSYIPMYTIGSTQRTEEFKQVDARFEQDSTGRLIKVTLKPGEEDEVTYAVTTNTITDQAKYDDAMNQYEYDKFQYDQAIQEINAKIEIIQNEDKNLELRLKQLDTEQEAIQTEKDAVQKVIEKNTESTFKTFG